MRRQSSGSKSTNRYEVARLRPAGRENLPKERERMRGMEREIRELRQANEILEGTGVFCPGGARPPVEAMIAFIDDHRAS
jgi:hypothetical protein